MSNSAIILAVGIIALLFLGSLVWLRAESNQESEEDDCGVGDGNTRREDHQYSYKDVAIAIESSLQYKKSQDKKNARENRRKFKIEFTVAAVVATSAGVSVLLWLAQLGSNEINTRNMIEANRAWIAPAKVEFERFGATGPVTVRVTVENVGHSPATNAVHIQNSAVTPLFDQPNVAWNKLPLWQTFKEQVGKRTKCDSLAPSLNGDTLFQGSGDFRTSIDITTPDGVDASSIRNASQLLVVFGCYAYRSMGSDHLTYFCYYPHPVFRDEKDVWIWGTCPVWHDAN